MNVQLRRCGVAFLLASLMPSIALSQSVMNHGVRVPLDVFKAADLPARTLIMLPGCDGYAGYYQNKARAWRRAGYNVVVVDSLQGRNATFGRYCSDHTLVAPGQIAQDAELASAWIKQQDWHKGKVGVIGYSAGGRAAEYVSIYFSGAADAVVAYYPWCEDKPRKKKLPMQIHMGTADTWTPAEQCKDPYYADTEVNFYEGATHAFDVNLPRRTGPTGAFMQRDEKAELEAFERSKAFFDRHLIQ